MDVFGALLMATVFAVKLPCGEGGQETYFLPLDEVKADVASMTLRTAAGEDVPFSFDARIDIPERPGFVRKPVDGYYSSYSYPLAEDACRRYGWLSFRAPKGAKSLELRFSTGTGRICERPDPAVRTWWVDLLRKPFVADETKGVLLDRTVNIPPGDFADISQLAGRRFVTLFGAEAPEGTPESSFYCIRIPSAAGTTPNVNAHYFGISKAGNDVITEGFVKVGVVPEFLDRRSAAVLSPSYRARPSKEPLLVRRFRLQSAPCVRLSGAKLASDLFNVGDLVDIRLPKSRGDVLVPFEADGIRGERVVTLAPDARIDVAAVLLDREGRAVKSGTGMTFSLAGVRPGRYDLAVALSSGGVALSESAIPVGIQRGPWEE